MKRILPFATIAVVLGASPVQAADPPHTYVVPVCGTTAGWTSAGSIFDSCSSGGGFGGIGTADGARWGFGDPAHPAPDIVALRVWRTASAPPFLSYRLEADEGEARARILEDTDDLDAGPAVGREFSLARATRITFVIWCSGEPCPGASGWVRFSRLEMVFSDAANPRVIEVGGAAFAGPPVSGTVDVGVSFADVGGGLRTVAMLVDGRVQETSTPKCSVPYTEVVPCPLSGMQAFNIDTRELSDGPHAISFLLSDVAGNQSLSKSYGTTVRNAPPVPAQTLKLAAMRPRMKAAFDTEPVVRATVRNAAGAAVAGVKVAVAIRRAATGETFVVDTPVFSDANGIVTVKLPKGPSREVKLTYGDQLAIAKITVKAPLRFKITPKRVRNGQTIRLRGTVPGAVDETKVELQAKSGKKWIPFKTVTLRDGRFAAGYRFTRTFVRTRYTFRAVIHSDPRFPYAPATSKVASVVVRP